MAVFFNLVTDSHVENQASHMISKISSFILITVILTFYDQLVMLTQTNPQQLTDFETEIILDKLDKAQALQHKPLRNLNLNFKLKIIMFIGVIVGL